jgi:hypothetical protein
MTGRIAIKTVLAVVAKVTGVSEAEMLGYVRNRRVSRIRHAAIWMARRHCPHLTCAEIGRRVGGRDHTTILNSVNRIESEVAEVGMDSELMQIELVLESTRKALAGLSIDDDDLDPLEVAGRAMTDHGVSRLTFEEIRCLAAYVIQTDGAPSPDDDPATAVIAVPALPGGDALVGAARHVVKAYRDYQQARYGRGEATTSTILSAAINDLHEAYLDLAAPAAFNPASNAPRKEANHA